jgi:hypothetical protein
MKHLKHIEVKCGEATHRLGIEAVLGEFHILDHDPDMVQAFVSFGAPTPTCYHVKDVLARAVDSHREAVWWVRDQPWLSWQRKKVLNQLKRAMESLVQGKLDLARYWAEKANTNALVYRKHYTYSSEPMVEPPTHSFWDDLREALQVSQGLEP